MFVNSLNLVSNFYISNSQTRKKAVNNKHVNINHSTQDVFIKTASVSFKGIEQKKNNDLLYDLAAVGVVGGTFLLALYGSIKTMKESSPCKIFLSGETYFMDTDEMSIKTSEIIADGDDGIFKARDAQIDIDPAKYKYDVVDSKNGIFKNNDGSVDIDLKNNKYIDKINGIFVDPEHQISVFVVDGVAHPITIPSFGSGTPPWNPGGGYHETYGRPNSYNYGYNTPNREEFIKTHDGKTPEEVYGFDENKLSRLSGYPQIKPNDYRSLFQRMKDFFEDANSPDTYDKTRVYDVFGRPIVKVTDHFGKVHNLALNDEMAELFHKKNIDEATIVKIAQFMNENRFVDYISENHPDYSTFLNNECESMEQFITRVSSLSENSQQVLGVNSLSDEIPPSNTSLGGIIEDIIDEISD